MMLHNDPDQRPSSEELLELDFFKKYNIVYEPLNEKNISIKRPEVLDKSKYEIIREYKEKLLNHKNDKRNMKYLYKGLNK